MGDRTAELAADQTINQSSIKGSYHEVVSIEWNTWSDSQNRNDFSLALAGVRDRPNQSIPRAGAPFAVRPSKAHAGGGAAIGKGHVDACGPIRSADARRRRGTTELLTVAKECAAVPALLNETRKERFK